MTALAPEQGAVSVSPTPIVHARPVDEERAVAAVTDLLEALGLGPGARLRPTTFPNAGGA